MMPMLRVRSRGNSRLAISLLLSLGVSRWCTCAGGTLYADRAIGTVFNDIGAILAFRGLSVLLTHGRAELAGTLPGAGLELVIADLVGIHHQLHPRPNVVRLQRQRLVDRSAHSGE